MDYSRSCIAVIPTALCVSIYVNAGPITSLNACKFTFPLKKVPKIPPLYLQIYINLSPPDFFLFRHLRAMSLLLCSQIICEQEIQVVFLLFCLFCQVIKAFVL